MSLLPLLILAILPSPAAVDYPGATTVFHCTFDTAWDENYDGWPDGWTRRTGPGYPHYVSIQISDDPSPSGNRCLRIDLDGAGAVAYSPLIPVGWFYGYVLQGELKTERLHHDRAFLSLTFLDRKRHRLAGYRTAKIHQAEAWTPLVIGPIEPRDKDVFYAVIGLHLEPGDQEDLKGAAVFDNLRLARLPRMSLSTPNRHGVYAKASEINVDCDVSGFTETDARVAFRLEDVEGRVLGRTEHALSVTRATGGTPAPASGVSDDAGGWRGHAEWRPAVPGPGFYRVRAELVGGRARCSGRLTLAVVESLGEPRAGQFGWSLPRGDRPLPLPVLGELIDRAGVRWVKYPVWYGRQASETSVEDLIGFSERLSAAGIEMVGMLSQPPPEIRDRFGGANPLEAADVFLAEPDAWRPSLEPVLMRLANRFQWWQLGGDGDTSFVGCPGLEERLRAVKTEMDRVGQNVLLGIGSNGVDAPPATNAENPCPAFVTLLSDSPLGDKQWTAYLRTGEETSVALGSAKDRDFRGAKGDHAPATDAPVARWVTLRPLPREGHAVDARATDLVGRMMAAKIHGVDAIFASDPFDARRGLFNPDGTPGELFLVWRTTALALGPGRHLGGVELPGGSPNEVFARAADAVMVVRGERPCEETLYLGDDVRQIDAWGREMPLRKEGHRQVIAVGPVPTFVVGLSEPVVRWRKDLSFGEKAIPSVPGRPHPNAFRVKNSFAVEAKVDSELVLPDGWRASPARSSFTLAPGGERQQPFAVTLPYDVNDGAFPVRIDFDVRADRDYRFSVYRRMEVGLGDVKIEYRAVMNAQGELEVTQRFLNATTGRVSFRCQLIAPGRQRLETQIIDLPPGAHEKTYRLAEGVKLLGKPLWLRAQEIGGSRKLNYRFVVEAENGKPKMTNDQAPMTNGESGMHEAEGGATPPTQSGGVPTDHKSPIPNHQSLVTNP